MVNHVRICNLSPLHGEGTDRNGKLWRWDFGEYFGPTFVGKKGDPLPVQPMEEDHPAWEPFEKWLFKHLASRISDAGKIALGRLTGGPMLRSTFNPGVVGRLHKANYIQLVLKPSPFANARGKKIQYAQITDLGRKVLHADQA